MNEDRELFQVLERLPEMRGVLATDGTILWVNKRLRNVLDMEESDLVGLKYWELPFLERHPGSACSFKAEVERAARGEVASFRAISRRFPGDERVVHFLLVPVTDVSGRVLDVVAIIRDMTRHHKALTALELERHFSTALIQASPAFIVALDRQGRILLMNDTMLRELGYASLEEVKGRDYGSLFLDERDRSMVGDLISQVYAGRILDASENDVLVRDGSRRAIEWRARVVTGEEQGFLLAIGIDVTKRKRAESEAKEREQQLHEAARLISLGTLVSGIAHEINNPNTYIRLNAQNLLGLYGGLRDLLEQAYPERGDLAVRGIPFSEACATIEKLVQGIVAGADRINSLVSTLKDFARQEKDGSRTGSLNEEVDVNSVMATSVLMLEHLVRKSTDSFTIEYGEELPPVRGSYHQLEQVVMSLLTNACEALVQGRQVVSIRSALEPGGWVAVRVRDEGCGIPPENIEHVFDPFFTTKRDRGGTGLGLSVAYGIVKRHGGTISVRSEPGAGADFTVRLPAAGKPL